VFSARLGVTSASARRAGARVARAKAGGGPG